MSLLVALSITLFLLCLPIAASADVDLEWDANTEGDIGGFKVFRGGTSATCASLSEIAHVVSTTPNYTVQKSDLLAGQTNFIAVKWFDTRMNVSGCSNIVTINPPVAEARLAQAVDVGGTVTISMDNGAVGGGALVAATVAAGADLAITKVGSVNTMLLGDELVYVIRVTNNGLEAATGVVLSDFLPDEVMFGSATTTQGTCTETEGMVTCELGELANGESATVTLVVTSTEEGKISNIASVTSSIADADTANNAAEAMTTVATVADSDLAMTTVGSANTIIVGDELAYTLTVTNNGPEAATEMELTDFLPDGVTFVAAIPTQGTCTEAEGTVTCELGELANGESVTVTLVVTPAVEGKITNAATVSSNIADANVANNSATVTTSVTSVTAAGADLVITTASSADVVAVGGELSYTLTVTNNGPEAATEVVLTDFLPDEVVFGFATQTQGACAEAEGTVTCELGGLANGATATITIVVTPIEETGALTNTAIVAGDELDPAMASNDATVTTSVTTTSVTLTVNLGGTGSGMVTSDPPGIDCGDDCTEELPIGTPVTLIASPAEGSVFTGWSNVECSGTDPCNFLAEFSGVVMATFQSKEAVDQPDLTGIITKLTREVKADGDRLVVKLAVRNQGTALATGPFSIAMFRSDDAVLDAADAQLATGIVEEDLAVGERSGINKLQQIGLAPVAGTFVLIVIDMNNDVRESAEANNTLVRKVEGIPDLKATIEKFKHEVKPEGDELVVKLKVRNRGTAEAGPFSIAMFLSDDAVLDPADERLATATIDNGLAAREKTDVIKLKRKGLPPVVSKVVIVVIDVGDTIAEANEANNTQAIPIASESGPRSMFGPE